MKTLPPDIERTIWTLAESNDHRAIDEFGIRYPDYKQDLVARIQMVRSLKGARPHREVPRLMLPQRRPAPSFGRVFGFSLAGAVLATMAFAAVYTANSSTRKEPEPKAEVVQSVVSPSASSEQSTPRGPLVAKDNEKPAENADGTTAHSGASTPADPFDRLVTVEVESTTVTRLIRDIAAQARLKIEFAPGFQEQTIAARYISLPARQVLDDLGQNFGFTLLVQSGNHALIVPAIDESKPPVTVPDGSFSEPKSEKPDDIDPSKLPGPYKK